MNNKSKDKASKQKLLDNTKNLRISQPDLKKKETLLKNICQVIVF